MEAERVPADSADARTRVPLMTRALSPALGAEILDVDASAPIDAVLSATLQDIWHQNLVLLLRDQRLSMEDQVRFAECFCMRARISPPPSAA